MVENVLLIIAGFFLLIKGASILVDGSSNIAKKLNISNIVIGLTIVAIGTSLPELMVCVKSAFINGSDIEIGSVLGSNICNILLVIGICAMFSPIEFKRGTSIFEIPISLIIIFTFFILANNSGIDKTITKNEGIVLIVFFFLYLSYTIFMAKYGELLEHKVQLITDEDEIGLLKSLFYVVIGIVALNFGGDFVVENLIEIIEKYKVSESVLALTVISIGTSLPELITSIAAILKKEPGIAIGNILGSNIFNILLILGVSSIINPIKYAVDFNVEVLILFIITAIILIIPYIDKKNYIGRATGIVFTLLYIIYIISIFNR